MFLGQEHQLTINPAAVVLLINFLASLLKVYFNHIMKTDSHKNKNASVDGHFGQLTTENFVLSSEINNAGIVVLNDVSL
jgi:hypothetical protein